MYVWISEFRKFNVFKDYGSGKLTVSAKISELWGPKPAILLLLVEAGDVMLAI